MLRAKMTEQPVTKIAGRYRLLKRLKRGSMSAVFLACDELAQQEAAIKPVPGESFDCMNTSGNKVDEASLSLFSREAGGPTPTQDEPLFENPFQMQDLLVFDNAEFRQMLIRDRVGFTLTDLAWSLHDAPQPLLRRVWRNVLAHRQQLFLSELRRLLTSDEIETAQRRVLDSLFWELTYWKTPDLYEELTIGEQLHPGIFAQLEPDVSGRVVLDAGAGSGRATFECLCHGARLVYAVEPSRGLLRILRQKVVRQHRIGQVVALEGRFDALPLGDKSVDVALACSSFTAEPEQGGEAGLAELKRVTKIGGKVVLIWPRREDYEWLEAHDFQGVTLTSQQEMSVHFKSLPSALRVARRFYARNQNVIRYIHQHHRPEVPFSVLGINPPHDYYWLIVK